MSLSKRLSLLNGAIKTPPAQPEPARESRMSRASRIMAGALREPEQRPPEPTRNSLASRLRSLGKTLPQTAAGGGEKLSFSKTKDSDFTPTPRAQAAAAKAPTTSQAAKLIDTKTLSISTIDAYRRMTGKNEMPRYISSIELAKLTD